MEKGGEKIAKRLFSALLNRSSAAHIFEPFYRVEVGGLGRRDCPGYGPSVPTTNRWVPHISLVFREMWDSTVLSLQVFRMGF